MNPITAAHLHLALCHAPVMGIVFGLAWLAAGLWLGNRAILQAGLVTLMVAGLLAVPLYLTGKSAAGLVKGLPEFSEHFLEQHQAAAGVTLAGCIAIAIAALAGLIHFRNRTPADWFCGLLLTVGLAVIGLLLWTALPGGQIRHSEIRAYDAPPE